MYYSLQYLSLSDATVLTFLTPMCTAMAGALFLGEIFTRREVFAGRKWILFQMDTLAQDYSVVSLVGVVLIARPTAIFGSASHPDSHLPSIPATDGPIAIPTSPVEKGTQTERLIAVGYVITSILNSQLK
jgi:EamA-like transporter family